MVDPFDAGRRALEDRDRTDALLMDARRILSRLDFDWSEDHEGAVARLMERGPFSRPDAYHILELIDWEDSLGEAS